MYVQPLLFQKPKCCSCELSSVGRDNAYKGKDQQKKKKTKMLIIQQIVLCFINKYKYIKTLNTKVISCIKSTLLFLVISTSSSCFGAKDWSLKDC